jgi:hypothetical protein
LHSGVLIKITQRIFGDRCKHLRNCLRQNVFEIPPYFLARLLSKASCGNGGKSHFGLDLVTAEWDQPRIPIGLSKNPKQMSRPRTKTRNAYIDSLSRSFLEEKLRSFQIVVIQMDLSLHSLDLNLFNGQKIKNYFCVLHSCAQKGLPPFPKCVKYIL